MSITTDLMTLEQYAAHEDGDERYLTELVRGVLVREPRPGGTHGSLQVLLGRFLSEWARPRGARVTAESGYVLDENPPTLRGPDLAVVLDARSGKGRIGGWIEGAPDVAVEILSPSDRSSPIHEKTLDYLQAGAREVWIVDPPARTVTVFRPDGTARVLRVDDTLDGGDVLAGFSLSLAELFSDL
ncbi:MAG: Uma2 family endonuclease [Gemmatimonadota bacterium]